MAESNYRIYASMRVRSGGLEFALLVITPQGVALFFRSDQVDEPDLTWAEFSENLSLALQMHTRLPDWEGPAPDARTALEGFRNGFIASHRPPSATG